MFKDLPERLNADGKALRDARLRFVQRTALLLFSFGALVAGAVSVWHRVSAVTGPLPHVAPPLLTVVLALLSWRQWRQPQRLALHLWLGWGAVVLGLALPAWWCVLLAARGGQSLVDLLPPIGAAFLPLVLVMALLATLRQALVATLVAWVAVAAPVLVYLLLNPAELGTPRGLELALALGPLALLVPLLLPLLRGMEQRFESLHREGERLQALAERDVLIGLYNRRAGERFLATLLAHSRQDAALVLFDIDHFKRINDRFGHPAGDAVLIEVGKRCTAALGPEDILARWGGEEFMVILPGQPPQPPAEVAERLRAAIQAGPIEPVGSVSASFGVTTVRPEDTLAEVVQRSDEALYRAKAAGRNRVIEA